jgi:hypothetical protein
MEIAHGLQSMWRDIVELATFDWVGRIALIGFVLLPAVALRAVVRGNRLGWVSLGVWFALVAVWFLYYATDWWGPVSGPLAFWIGVLALGIGWATALQGWAKGSRSARG